MFASVFIRYIFQTNIRLIVFRRWLFLQGVMFGLRSISIYITSLTVPQPGCNITTTEGDAGMQAIYVMLTIKSTCGDVMFSGHTMTITLCALFWTNYSKGEEYIPFIWIYRKIRRRSTADIHLPNNTDEEQISFTKWQRFWRSFFYPKLDATGDPMTLYLTSYIIWLYAITGYIIIIATRFHYSVDVFIGFIITILLFKTYHFYIKTLLERRRIIISRFFIWFESIIRDQNIVAPDASDQQQLAGVPVSILTGNDNRQNSHNANSAFVLSPGDGQPV
ncbi:unnamed protein product [Didymodactylos carnosus]|uniref:Sphingomyelin synthase-like domain-containing protein n=1 Tax=Didymodactylos carnosus TaxID=1234261 RepID=A0A814YQD6_9BILA|nr:unnamed protein product [Didymodactylos carnosus]CAF1351606.1 unnamed protein product [Didymodactylos carnosus]CAF3995494.1 unnamed protein product [Didymodactylos carnosus]CAF4162087.1 unnamed protein product [Didymodactylos carnosus]